MSTNGVAGPFERCRSCTAELSPGRDVCPACGTVVPRSPTNALPKPRWSTGRKISHAIIAVLLVIVANMYRPYVQPYLRPMWPPWLAPYVGEAMTRVEANKQAMALLGGSVSHSRFVRGGVRKYDSDMGAARFRVAVTGANGKGVLQAALGQVDGTWVFSELRLILDSGGKVVDLLDGADQPVRAVLETGRQVYLVPLGDVDQEAIGLKELPEFYRKKFNLEVTLLKPLPIEEKAWDRKRRQLIAEELVELMLRRLPHLAKDSKAMVIGVTREDMYYREKNWNFAYNFWSNQKSGLVSSHRIDVQSSSLAARQQVKSRVRKLTSRVVGMLVYELPRSQDPTSVLAEELYGSFSIDLMSDEFDGLGSLAVIDGFTRMHWLPAFTPTVTPGAVDSGAKRVDDGYPCVLVRRDQTSNSTNASWQGKVTKCLPQAFTDVEVDEVEVDLRSGLLMTRETDLFLGGVTPIAATRCYRLWDDEVRAFGYNRGMSWDMFPYGSRNPYTYIKMFLCDGRTVHFDRISEGVNYADALFEHKETATTFLRARFGWTGNGWDLAQADGTHLYFPESYNAKRGVDGAMVAFTGPNDNMVTLQRDSLRNLRQLSTVESQYLRFEYDARNRVSKAMDSHGRFATYLYDMAGRLVQAKTPKADRRYTYTGTDLESIRENGSNLFLFRYSLGRVSELILTGGQSYKIRYDNDPRDDYTPVRTYLTSPDGKTEKFIIRP